MDHALKLPCRFHPPPLPRKLAVFARQSRSHPRMWGDEIDIVIVPVSNAPPHPGLLLVVGPSESACSTFYPTGGPGCSTYLLRLPPLAPPTEHLNDPPPVIIPSLLPPSLGFPSTVIFMVLCT